MSIIYIVSHGSSFCLNMLAFVVNFHHITFVLRQCTSEFDQLLVRNIKHEHKYPIKSEMSFVQEKKLWGTTPHRTGLVANVSDAIDVQLCNLNLTFSKTMFP